MTATDALAAARSAHAGALARGLERLTAQLAAMPQVERVVLFGSYAAGRRDLFTDLDLLVVMRSELPFAERTARLYRELEAGVDLDLLAYTPEEIEANRHRGFLRHVLEHGRVIHEKRPPG